MGGPEGLGTSVGSTQGVGPSSGPGGPEKGNFKGRAVALGKAAYNALRSAASKAMERVEKALIGRKAGTQAKGELTQKQAEKKVADFEKRLKAFKQEHGEKVSAWYGGGSKNSLQARAKAVASEAEKSKTPEELAAALNKAKNFPSKSEYTSIYKDFLSFDDEKDQLVRSCGKHMPSLSMKLDSQFGEAFVYGLKDHGESIPSLLAKIENSEAKVAQNNLSEMKDFVKALGSKNESAFQNKEGPLRAPFRQFAKAINEYKKDEENPEKQKALAVASRELNNARNRLMKDMNELYAKDPKKYGAMKQDMAQTYIEAGSFMGMLPEGLQDALNALERQG